MKLTAFQHLEDDRFLLGVCLFSGAEVLLVSGTVIPKPVGVLWDTKRPLLFTICWGNSQPEKVCPGIVTAPRPPENERMSP